jgi:WD40 repeat protein
MLGADFSVKVRSTGSVATSAMVLSGHGATVRHLSYSSDGARLRTTSADGTWRIWNARSGEELERGKADGGFAAFSADGENLVTVTADGARVLSLAKRSAPVLVRGHEAPVVAAALSPDGRRLVTAATNGIVRVWTIDWHELIARLRGSTVGCLTSDQRAELLEESASKAALRAADCDRSHGRSPPR